MKVFIAAAARSIIAPKGGHLKDLQLHELAAPALQAVWQGIRHKSRLTGPESVILGNALGAGGNPARVAAIAAFGPSTAGVTIDTQCCSGIDTVSIATAQLRVNAPRIIIAGGVESSSAAPIRLRKTARGLVVYDQAQFSPDPTEDPNVIEAAQQFAIDHRITRELQEEYAIKSHHKALSCYGSATTPDPFARRLSAVICKRMGPLVSLGRTYPQYAITAATVSPLADAAAALLLVNQKALDAAWFESSYCPIEIVASAQVGGSPMAPAIAGAKAAERILNQITKRDRTRIGSVEVMESFSAQALHNQRVLKFSDSQVNRWGGLLSKGHPIGASAAILLGNIFYQLQNESSGTYGLALIPAAGGMGSAMLLRKP